MEMEGLDCVCVQETHLPELHCVIEGIHVWASAEKAGAYGVLVALNTRWATRVKAVSLIDCMLMEMQLDVGNRILHLVNCYAPHSARPAEEKNVFWNNLKHCVSNGKKDWLK
eukprot:10198303-Prorocentrum_lima.AAC.1